MADLDTLRTKVDEQASRYETIILYKNEWRLLSSALDENERLRAALKRCVTIVDHAVEHYKGAVATKIRREITLHARAALRPAETGEPTND